VGARDDEGVEKGRRMEIGPENGPDFNDAGDISWVGNWVKFPSGSMEETWEISGLIVS